MIYQDKYNSYKNNNINQNYKNIIIFNKITLTLIPIHIHISMNKLINKLNKNKTKVMIFSHKNHNKIQKTYNKNNKILNLQMKQQIKIYKK